MKRRPFCLLIALSVGAAALVPNSTAAQATPADSARLRGECRSAHQVLVSGKPADRRARAMSISTRALCVEGPEAMAAAWTPAPRDSAEAWQFAYLTRGVADRRIMRALIAVVQSQTVGMQVRLAASDVLISYARPGRGLRRRGVAAPEGAILYRPSHDSQRSGTQPITPADRREIVEVFREQANTDRDPHLRRVFAAILMEITLLEK